MAGERPEERARCASEEEWAEYCRLFTDVISRELDSQSGDESVYEVKITPGPAKSRQEALRPLDDGRWQIKRMLLIFDRAEAMIKYQSRRRAEGLCICCTHECSHAKLKLVKTPLGRHNPPRGTKVEAMPDFSA